MHRIVHIFLYLLSLLPLQVLYLFSHCLFFIVYHIWGYRKKVVFSNLKKAFPDYSEKERTSIAKNFYHTYLQQAMETVKTLSVSEKMIRQRVKFIHDEDFNHLSSSGKPAILLLGHIVNWEWAGQVLPVDTGKTLISVYKRVKSRTFNDFMEKIRTRFSMEVVPMTHALRRIMKERARPNMYSFLTDQTPPVEDAGIWAEFFGITLPFYTGPERIASRLGLPVYFVRLNRSSKGRFEGRIILISENAGKEEKDVIMKKYIALLEENIRSQPELWLWSHRRWKHEGKAP